jgi:signal transduction histidine kinase
LTKDNSLTGNDRSATPCAAASTVDQVQFLSIVVDHIDQGFLAWDHDHTLKLWNRAYVKLLGYPENFLYVGQPLIDLARYHAKAGVYGKGDAEALAQERYDLLISDKKITNAQLTFANERVLQMQRRIPSGKVFAGVITYTDITELQATREALIAANQDLEHKVDLRTRDLRTALERAEMANRAKSDFLAHMSHELRTPLNSIIGFSDIIRKEIFGPLNNARYLDYTEDIKTSGQHLLGVITDILDIAKIEAGEARLDDEILDIGKLVDETIRMVASRAVAQGLSLRTRIHIADRRLNVDRLRVKQILLNLLTNAIKFTPANGKIMLSVEHDATARTIIKISDTGIGIKTADIEHVLQPFGQVMNSFINSGEGTGLGLALSKMLMETHGGTLDIKSEPNKGTTVRLIFPTERTVA